MCKGYRTYIGEGGIPYVNRQRGEYPRHMRERGVPHVLWGKRDTPCTLGKEGYPKYVGDRGVPYVRRQRDTVCT